MSRMTRFLASLAVVTIAVGLSGCPAEPDATPPADADEAQTDEHAGHDHGDDDDAAHDHGDDDDHAGHDHGDDDDHAGHDHGGTGVAEELAKLSDEDRTAAEKQKTCPVTGDLLGSDGTPIKVTVTAADGTQHDVFICCKGCQSPLEKDPDKYLAKLNP